MVAKKKASAKTVLILRSCSANLTSHGDFQWPGVGEVAKAEDWNPTPECGHGLHGWLYGAGDHSVSEYREKDSKWLVVEVLESSIVDLGGKVKFPSCTVRCIGTMKEATDYLIEHEPMSAKVAVIGATICVDNDQVAVVGSLGTATAGYEGTATAGYLGTATAGDYGKATAGNYGKATAGYKGTATAGDEGTATAGTLGTATAGDKGEIHICYWDDKASRYRTIIGYIGEDGLLPNTAYRLDDAHQFVKV